MKKIFFLLLISLVVISCARVGSPDGGKKDSLAPKFLSSNIDTTRINVPRNIKELRLDFDEYVMLKDVSKNLIISPPIKYKKVIPSNLANKYVLIQWEDSLKANTTYNFNFGNAIVDNNEGNILPYFNFAFSTGDKVDDTFISGTVEDAMAFKKKNETAKDNKYVVGLYPIIDDKTDFKQKPSYIAKVDEENYFELNYLQKGDYIIIAFDDENQNSIYDAGKEKVGFLKDKITVSDNVKGVKLKLYPSKKAFKFIESKPVFGGAILAFEGNPEKLDIKSISPQLSEYKIEHQPKSDTVNIWFNDAQNKFDAKATTQLEFSYDTSKKQDTVRLYYKPVKDEFKIENKGGNLLVPNQDFKITANLPLQSIDTKDWKLESDSVAVNFKAKISEKNPYEILVSADFKPTKKYALTVIKGSVKSYFEGIIKSYKFEFQADKSENYGGFVIKKFVNKPKSKFWVELTNEKGEVLYSKYTNDDSVSFINLKPAVYIARIKVDDNENGIWNEADFANNILAEPIYIYEKTIEVRPLWTIEEDWEIK